EFGILGGVGPGPSSRRPGGPGGGGGVGNDGGSLDLEGVPTPTTDAEPFPRRPARSISKSHLDSSIAQGVTPLSRFPRAYLLVQDLVTITSLGGRHPSWRRQGLGRPSRQGFTLGCSPTAHRAGGTSPGRLRWPGRAQEHRPGEPRVRGTPIYGVLKGRGNT